MKKHKLYIALFTTIHWVKPALPAEPISLTVTLLMGGPSGRRRRVEGINCGGLEIMME